MVRSLSALATTDTELRLMAAAAIIGLSSRYYREQVFLDIVQPGCWEGLPVCSSKLWKQAEPWMAKRRIVRSGCHSRLGRGIPAMGRCSTRFATGSIEV